MLKDAASACNRRFSLLTLLIAVVLTGCASSTGAPVVDRQHHGQSQTAAKPVTSGTYVVRPKDTLYSIAFRFGRDWKELAASNGINAPYTIKPGQVISLSKKPARSARVPVAKPVKPAQTAKQQVPERTTTPKSVAKPASTVTTSKPVDKSVTKPVAAAASGKWLWPAEGAVITRFSSSTKLNKGIDIAGQLCQPVRATAKGTVVYAGSDVLGYGELIIIKHDDTYISAYGHNRRLLVNEGQQVAAGQQVAEMGSTGTERVKLHFEIRRQGTPVDPLQYLPGR